MKKLTFVAAMKDYFGLLPNETNTDFMAEIKALTPEDRAQFTAMLATVGYEIVSAA